MLLGKHEDFIFEGVKKNSGDKKLKNIEKTMLPFDKSSKHRKFVARFVILFIAFALIASVVSISNSGINLKVFGRQKSIRQLEDKTNIGGAFLATCSNFEGFDKRQCMLFAGITNAISRNDISLCNKNPDCEDAFYFDNAEKQNDAAVCEKIIDNNAKAYCGEAIEASLASSPEKALEKELASASHLISELDFSECNAMNEISAANCKDNIVAAKALSSKDAAYCQLAEDKMLCQGFYYKQQALIYNDKNLCSRILHAELKGECLG